ISAHQFLQPRSAFREAGKVHGLSDEQVSNLLTGLAERVDDLLVPGGGAPASPAPGAAPSALHVPRGFPLEGERWPRLVADARRHARPAGGGQPPARALDTDRDPATAALLRRGDALGVNQLESPAMRHLLIQMQPRGIDDVVQSLALLRPGAASVGMKE